MVCEVTMRQVVFVLLDITQCVSVCSYICEELEQVKAGNSEWRVTRNSFIFQRPSCEMFQSQQAGITLTGKVV